MYLFKVVNNSTGRTLISLSKVHPNNFVALKFNLAENEEGIPPFERDLLNFSPEKFSVVPICELRNEAKAKKKANHYISQQDNPYNTFYYEVSK